MEVCIECSKENSLIFDESEGNIVCCECGIVNSFKVIDESAEWRDFEDNDGRDPRRVGMPNNDLLSDRGLGTTISESFLKRWGQRSQRSSSDSALIKTFTEMDRISSSLSFSSSLSEKCKKLFKKVYSSCSTKGKSHMAILCVCIFITCRKFKYPFELSELVRECSVDKNKILKVYELVKQQSRKVFPLTHGQKLAVRFAEEFEMNCREIENILNIFDDLEESEVIQGDDNVKAVVTVLLIDSLQGTRRDFRKYSEVSGKDCREIVDAYRLLFKNRFSLLKGMASSWEIANMFNL
jgi:transcription initiation factor TFIIB